MAAMLTTFAVSPITGDITEFCIDKLTYRTTGPSTQAVYNELRRALYDGNVPLDEVLSAIEELGARRVE